MKKIQDIENHGKCYRIRGEKSRKGAFFFIRFSSSTTRNFKYLMVQ